MTNNYYIMSFDKAIEVAESVLRDGYDVEIRRIGTDSAQVFAVRKKKIKRPGDDDDDPDCD